MATDTTKITGAADELSAGLTKGGTAAKTLGAEIANAIKSLDGRVAALEAGGTSPPITPPPTGSAMTDCTNQNTKGKSEATPAGVPHSYSWYNGKSEVQGTIPPAGYTAVNGWGALYPEEYQTHVAGKVTIQKMQTWVVTKAGVWTCVQDQSKGQLLEGAHYPADFSDFDTVPWDQTNNSDGSATVNAPPAGFTDHYWPGGRGTFVANTVAGVFVLVDTKAATSSMRFVNNVGADWWPAATGGIPPNNSFSNPGVGMCNWIKLNTGYRRSYFYSMSDSAFQANLPPPMRT